MSRQISTYAAPMTPVTPVWASSHDPRSIQSQRLLPSAMEMTTPPQTVPRKQIIAGPQGHSAASLSSRPMVDQKPGPNMATVTASPAASQPQPGPIMTCNMDPTGMFPMAEMQQGYLNQAPQQPPPNPMFASQQEMMINSGMRMPQLVVNDFRQQGYQQQGYQQQGYHQSAYPSIQNSYAQYYQGGIMPRGPMTAPPRIATGRVSKLRRNPAYSPQGLDMHGSEVAASRSSSVVKSEYAPESQDRYAAYNHYILRHAADEKSKVIWSAEVEAAFMEAVWLIPGESCKILMDRRVRGRNELISDYLKRELGEVRTRKQVSSHLQVLKKLLRNDEEFLEYVGPKKSDDGGNSEATDRTDAASKSRSDMSATSLEQLIGQLKESKRNQPKPAFLRQALANLELSRTEGAGAMSQEESNLHLSHPSHPQGQSLEQNIHQQSQHLPLNTHMHMPASIPHSMPSGMPSKNSSSTADNMPNIMASDMQDSTQSVISGNAPPQRLQSAGRVPPLLMKPSRPVQGPVSAPSGSLGSMSAGSSYVAGTNPPLRHPKPVHAQELEAHNIEPIITPSASVPPKEAVEQTASPRRHNPHLIHHQTRHHRRTTSASVDLSGDRVLPVQFRMVRTTESGQFVYSRLLRATYESPLHPLQLQHLIPKFAELSDLAAENKLAGAQVVHANVALYVKPIAGLDAQEARDQYSSDVQFVVTCQDPTASPQHRYIAKTVVTSRGTELLRCDIPCLFQRLAGRGLEQDKEVVSVPFLPDFWSDFLARLNNSDHEYVQAALSALTMYQAVYRVKNGQEEVCFVSLYQFSAAQDEFSARTRFRRVKGVPSVNHSGGSASSSKEPSVALGSPTKRKPTGLPMIQEPSTPTRATEGTAGQQTPKPAGTPALLGIGTPGQALSSLGSLMNYESPMLFASPRRMTAYDSIELGASPFTAVISNEARGSSQGSGSPNSPKFEIQRAMTAFEPSAWDEMHDWIYQ